jgi:hypothetical protein
MMTKKILLGICMFLIIIFMSSQVFALSLERDSYLLGELVKFDLDSTATDVKITNDNANYRLINSGSSTQYFLTQNLGRHTISVYDSSNNILSSKDFFVVDNFDIKDSEILKTNKINYETSEEVLITFNVDISNFNLYIKKGDSTYSFIGEPKSPLTFYPATPGLYEVILEAKDTSKTFTYSFNVNSKDATIRTISRNSNKISEIISQDAFSIQTTSKRNINIPLNTADLNSVSLQNALVDESSSIIVEDISKSKNLGVGQKNNVKAYLVEIDAEFDVAVINSVAKGNELYECDDWDYLNEICLSSWNKIKDLTPGEEYEVSMYSSNTAYAETGVATVNTKKPIYRPGEIAELLMVVLDTEGYLVPFANVSLDIVSPIGVSTTYTTNLNQIIETEPGIYSVNHTALEEGVYKLFVSAKGRNVDSNLSSYFVVKEEFEFDIIRTIPATIDPWQGPFESKIKITSFTNTSNFSLTEVLPNTFTITNSGGAVVTSDATNTYLTWNYLSNNSEVSYTANSPLITPDVWNIGPLFVNYDSNTFYEARPWILAIDPITFYDPSSTITSEWDQGTGTTHTEINGGGRQPSNPGTGTHVRSQGNSNQISEFGFPSVTESGIEAITLWVYTGTGSNVQYTFELRQGATNICSNSVPSATANQWRSCVWNNPTGSLADLRLYLGPVTRASGGSLQFALVYSAYLEVDTGLNPPVVTLNNPANNSIQTATPFNFQFTVTDETFSTLSCDLYTNISGSWAVTATNAAVTNNTLTSFSQSPSDGVYLWNVQCDNTDKTSFATSNRTVTVNAVSPLIQNAALNESSIRQNRTVEFSANITDSFGIDNALITLQYPNSTLQNITLSNTGDIYSTTITNTLNPGTYTITLIWANDTLGQITQNTSPGLSFTVNAIPPDVFELITPIDNTEAFSLNPTLNWEETITPDFKNYTILLSKSQTFNTIDFTYNTFQISNTTFTVTSALDANSVYYWKVIAYDIFGNSRNSTSTFRYVNDRISPTVTLNSPQNNGFLTNSLATFTYTPNDANNIASCRLYGNFSGTWQLVQTNTTITKATTNFFIQTIPEGPSIWNVQCFDLANNSAFATSNRTVILDTTGPVITLVSPANNSLINNTNIVKFTANANDELATINSCSLLVNGSVEQTLSPITEGVDFEFDQFLANNNYYWQISCLDTNNNEGFSEIRNLEVESLDNDPPVIDLEFPNNNQHLNTGNVLFNYTVSDATGIEWCALYLNNVLEQNSTSVENFEYNNFSVSSLSEGSYVWRVECLDNSSEFNLGVSINRTFSVDLTNPVVTLNAPNNNSFFSNSLVEFNYTPSDTNLDYCSLYTDEFGWSAVQTNNSPSNNIQNTFTYSMSDGSHLWNVLCFDLSNRSGFATNNFTITVDTTPPQFSDLSQTPESPVLYDLSMYFFNATISDNFDVDTVLFEHNFSGSFVNETVTSVSDFYSFNISDLNAGSYSFRWFANDTASNLNNTNQFTYIVNKAQSNINLDLNGSSNNLTINQYQNIALSANIITPSSGNIRILRNGIEILTGSNSISDVFSFNTPGLFNITAMYDETTNYNSSFETYFVEVIDITNPVVTLTIPSNNSLVGTGDVTLFYTVFDETSINSCSVYVDNVLTDTDNSVTINTTQSFIVNLPDEQLHSWRVECDDSQNNTGVSETRFFTTVDTDAILVSINTNEEYEVGELLDFEVNTTDIFGNPLDTSLTVSLIKGETNKPWWNFDWKNRKQIFLNETTGSAQTNALTEVNITNVLGTCNQLRIINQRIATPMEVPFNIHASGGDWCLVAFNVNLTANEVNNNDFYVYHNNTVASAPSSFLDTTTTTNFFATQSAADEGTPTNVANIIGFNDATFAELSQGGGGGTHSAHGRAFIDSIPGSTVYQVRARYRYAVPQTAASTLWELRYSVNGGTSYLLADSGILTSTQTTSSWFNITSAYSSLTWTNLNNTRLQSRITKTGGGSNTMNFYWAELEVTHTAFPVVSQTSTGSNQIIINQTTGNTGVDGLFDWNVSSKNFEITNYSVVTLASATSYTTSSGFSQFEIVPDVTPPNVTLLLPENNTEVGRGNYDFTYFVSDLNLDSCTLYLGADGNFDPIQTNTTPENNQNNTFSNVSVNLGLYEWNVLCNDDFSNEAFATQNFTLNVSGPDLVVKDILFDNVSLVEGSLMTVFANISNDGRSDTNGSFIVQFYLGDPDIDGIQIGNNITISNLDINQSVLVNETFMLQAGNNNVFVLVDPDDEVDDIDLTNNKDNNLVVVELYQYFYGNVTVDLILATSASSLFVEYSNLSGLSGHILVAHADAVFSFENLQAITRNIDGNFVSGDFDNVDSGLNSTSFSDSIKQVFGAGTNTPIETRSFNLSSGVINNVPVAQSTDNANFKTGILWDTADDLGNERYDASDKETLVFITEINPQQTGKYGVYDYELRVPALLRDYEGSGSNLVFYVEII